MPVPLSITVAVTCCLSFEYSTRRIMLFSKVLFIAFDSKLMVTCQKRALSPITNYGTSAALISKVRMLSLMSHLSFIISVTSCTASFRLNFSETRLNLLDLRRSQSWIFLRSYIMSMDQILELEIYFRTKANLEAGVSCSEASITSRL